MQESPYNVGLDVAIIMNPQTWITTGHVSSFSDPLLDCTACKARHRADKLIAAETRIPVLVAESPLDCVVDGTGICLEHPLDK